MTILTRESYLAQRADWKTRYAQLTTRIRDLKRKINQNMRDGLPAGGHQQALPSWAAEATSMMEELKALKAEARAAYAAQHSQAA